MSSILKALRKLEDDYPRTPGGNASAPQIPGVKKSLRRWEINSGRFAPVLWAALVIVVFAAAAWFLIYMRSPDQEPAPMAELPEAPVPTAAVRQQRPVPAAEPDTAVRSATPGRTEINRRRGSVRTGTQPGTAPGAVSRARPDQRQHKPALLPSTDQAAAPTATQVPIMQSGLELQAVSWASDPKNRIAVINGSIVREGGGIEGYSVLRIEQDEVLVSKGLSRWRLVFDSKK